MPRPVDNENRENVREMILETARPIFQRKGFLTVSMTDLITASGLSRGGFYYYYGSVAEVFRDTVNRRTHSKFVSVRQDIRAGGPFEEILDRYFELQKTRLLHIDNSMVRALYEYLFTYSGEQVADFRDELHENIRGTVCSLLQLGVDQGKVHTDDVAALAEQLSLIIEGLNVLAMLHGLTEETIMQQFALFKKAL